MGTFDALEVGLFQNFDHDKKVLKTTKITISQKTPFFKITKSDKNH